MIRTIISTCLGVLLAVAVLIAVWAALRWSTQRLLTVPPSTYIQPTYAERMVQLGYWHDHATDRWYDYLVIFQDHCHLIAGTQADATLQCSTPLDPRLGLPNKEK